MQKSDLIIVRGAGDISTGTIHRLFRAGFPVLALESERPSAIRRKVALSEAVYDGSATVEGVTAILAVEDEVKLRMAEESMHPAQLSFFQEDSS